MFTDKKADSVCACVQDLSMSRHCYVTVIKKKKKNFALSKNRLWYCDHLTSRYHQSGMDACGTKDQVERNCSCISYEVVKGKAPQNVLEYYDNINI